MERRRAPTGAEGGPAIRRAGDAELTVVADNFRRMWIDMGWHPETLRDDWAGLVAAFVERARSEGDFAAFVAALDGEVVGTAACQVFAGLYPEIRRGSAHRAGYVWGVYVEPPHRRRGLATRLTRAALAHLEAIGCTQVKLHASRDGEPVYRALGFQETNELVRALGPSRQASASSRTPKRST